ncbi:PIF1-like helicase, partial [Rhizoctonia solani AG-3 Rhs1AP]
MHAEVPNIVCLQVHLPEQQSVTFREGQLIENVVANAKDTTLTAFFKLNSHADAETRRYANELVYQEIPSRFSWHKPSRKWRLRRLKRNNDGVVQFTSGALGRMYFAPPNSGERFYLRTLLTVVRGPTSYEDLRTFNGAVFGSFKEACIARGLLESDEEWAQCLAEAAQFKTGQQMRRLFVVILTACNPAQPDQLWARFREQICDDLKYKLSHEPWNRPDASDVHLPEQQSVTFREGQLIENVVANAKDTTLTAFFKLNSHADAETRRYANELVYQEIPSRFSWHKPSRKWRLRRLKRNNDGVVQFTSGALGRMYFAPPNSGERFYLRTLLTVVRGPTSYEDLRTFNGAVFGSFKEACIARGLLESDEEWAQCLAEAAQFKTGQQMRRLFVVILTACNPAQPDQLWARFREQICDDLKYKLSHEPWNRPDASDEDVFDFGLYLIEILVLETGSTMRDCNMPTCTQNWDQINQEQNRLIREQYVLRDEQPVGIEFELQEQLNDEQRESFQRVLASVNNDEGTTFFLDGPAGTGKTFLYQALCYTLRAQDKIVLCVASSGLAALLLPGGKTSHSVFKIPIDIKANSTCNIPKRSNLAALIARTALIIWDEVPMQDRFCVEAFNRTCTDIGRRPDKAFGGITVVFGGDFRQTLPVVPKGTPEQIIAQCLKESPLWAGMEKLRLTRNMRLQGDPEMAEFAAWLLEVGEGHQIPRDKYFADIAFKPSMRVASRDVLIDKIYGDLSSPHHVNDEYLRGRTILTPRNDDVIILNKKILEKFPGQPQVFHSADKVIYEAGVDDERLGTLSTEYLNSLNSGSVPLSKLELKEGCPIMVLRNLARSQGVCNGTRGVVTRMGSRVLEVRLLTGSEAGR